MLRSVVLALVAGVVLSNPLPALALAQAPTTPTAYAFCSVTDTSSAQAKIWASPVFPVTYAPSDPAGGMRSLELAGEFLAHVGTLGGQGTKSCVVLATQSEAASFREKQRATWAERVYFIKIGDWREVAWTPAPWSPATAATPPAELTRYFYCNHVDTDVPNDLSHTVATTVFARKIPSGNPMAAYEMAAAYTAQFKQQVRAHGLPEKGDCAPFDTQGEADHQQRLILRHFKGFNMKYDEIAWTPDDVAITAVPAAAAAAAAVAVAAAASTAPAKTMMPAAGLGIRINAVTAELAQALGLPSTQGAWVVEVANGSAAMKVGIKPMDVLLEIAGQAVSAPADVGLIVGRLRPGFAAPVQVWRNRHMQTVTVAIPAAATHTAGASAVLATGATPAASVPASAPTASPAAAATTTTPPVPAPAVASDRLHCTAFVTHTKSGLHLRTPIWDSTAGQDANAAMSASLQRLIGAVVQANPETKWMKFAPTVCHDNSGVFAGETFCVSITHKHFGGAQMAAQFCNPSKELIDKRWADMVKADGGQAQVLSWPAGS